MGVTGHVLQARKAYLGAAKRTVPVPMRLNGRGEVVEGNSEPEAKNFNTTLAIMADTIPDHYQFQFSTNWLVQVQQKQNRLAEYVVHDHFEGTRKKYDKVKKTSSVRITGRKRATTVADIDDEVLWATAAEYEVPATLLDEWDETKLKDLVLPGSQYVEAHRAAWNRDRDDNAWRTALLPTATGADGTTMRQLTGHTVTLTGTAITGVTGHTVAAASAGLTIDKLIDLAGAIDISDVDDADVAPRVLVCHPKQLTGLLKEQKVQSADYNTIRALVAGTVDTFMGFKFIRNTRLPLLSGVRTCVAWAKGAVAVSEKPLKIGKMDIRTDLSDTLQIRSTWRLGGVRTDDELVATVACVEA